MEEENASLKVETLKELGKFFSLAHMHNNGGTSTSSVKLNPIQSFLSRVKSTILNIQILIFLK